MLNFIILLLASFGPGLFWLWIFYRQDRYQPEPAKMIYKVFGAGILLVIPAGLLEQTWRNQLLGSIQDNNWIGLLVMSFLVISLIEEGLKSLFLIWFVGRSKELDEPVDGIIYGVTLGLGFASLENFLWAYLFGIQIAALRAVVTTLAHAAFTGWMGRYLSNYRLNSGASTSVLWSGFLIAFVSHGLYDFLLFLRNPFSAVLAFALVGFLIFRLYREIKNTVAVSPFRH